MELIDKEELLNDVRQFVALKDQISLLAKRESEIKARLSKFVEQQGEVDGKGHLVFDLDDSVSGVAALVRQRKVSKSEDREVAEKLLKDKGLWDTCSKKVEIINQDAVMAARFKGELTEEDIDLMYPAKVTYAFLVNR